MQEQTESQEVAAPVSPDEKAQERMIPASEVNEIVRNRMASAAQKARAETMAEMQAQSQQQMQSQQMPQQANAGQMGGMPQMTDDMIRRVIQDEAHRQMAHQDAANFRAKLEAAKTKYPDIEEKIAKLNLSAVPHIAQWANGLDNTADIMVDIADHPEKFAHLLTLSAVSPQLAHSKLNELSQSIKVNEAAKQVPSAPEPLDESKPSHLGSGSGEMTMKDWKARYKG